jgi:hypothetical protein
MTYNGTYLNVTLIKEKSFFIKYSPMTIIVREPITNVNRSRDSSVGITVGYGLDDRGSKIRFPAENGNFSLHHRIQNGSGAHPASYPMGTRGFLLGSKAAGS